MWGETRVELPRRISAFIRRRGAEPGLGDELAAACLAALEANIVILDQGIYAALEEEARERSVRDPRDWPVVASALALNAQIWTKASSGWSACDGSIERHAEFIDTFT